jgi:DNA-binding NtrC family response regulator
MEDSMRTLSNQLRLISDSDLPALISGLPGSGRRFAARTIHDLGRRRNEAFAVVDCSVLNAALGVRMSSPEHQETAVSDLCERLSAQFVLADGGTVLLKDVDQLPLVLQGVLPRLIEYGELPVDPTKYRHKVDVRVLATHGGDLYQQALIGNFREDLLHRLDVLNIDVPLLRKRRREIAPLIRLFTERYAQWYRLPKIEITMAAMNALENYRWPKNIRELRLVTETLAVARAGELIELKDLPSVMRHSTREMAPPQARMDRPGNVSRSMRPRGIGY